jgi:hypothetical protein
VLSTERPPLVQVSAAELGLQALSAIPTTTAIIPPIPAPLHGV